MTDKLNDKNGREKRYEGLLLLLFLFGLLGDFQNIAGQRRIKLQGRKK